jgi:hypothetical protein
MSVPAAIADLALESLSTVELVRRQEHFTLALLGRISSGQSHETQSHLVKAGLQSLRELLALRDKGYSVSASTVEIAWGAIFEGYDRLIELTPADDPRPWPRL